MNLQLGTSILVLEKILAELESKKYMECEELNYLQESYKNIVTLKLEDGNMDLCHQLVVVKGNFK